MNNLILKIIILSFMFSLTASGNTVWEYVDEKLEKKEFKRWSLASWFYQKEQMSLQDQWLAMNLDSSGILVEFYLDYSQINLDEQADEITQDDDEGFSGEAAAYFGFIGLTGQKREYGDAFKSDEVALNLRLIGSSHQSTHLILNYGSRNLENNAGNKFKQDFFGGDISLYLVSFFGFDARYRKYSAAESNDSSLELSSTRSQWGAFLDIKFLRLYLNQFEEKFETEVLASGSSSKSKIKGTSAGVRLYF